MGDDVVTVVETHAAQAVAETINGRFELVRYLGRGGMGDVVLVRDSLHAGAQLALKRLRSDKIDARSVAIIRNEFLALSSLSHPNLVRVHEFGTDRRSGDLFFTLEYVEGSNWLDASRGIDFKTQEGLEGLLGILSQVLRALQFVHGHGLVHGDIKPENLLVVPSTGAAPEGARGDQVKLIDFGLVRKEGSPREEKILGTPYYVSPETILGSAADPRSDLYSLGVVLYHLATGRPPFLGDSNLVILRSHVEKPPAPPHEVARGLSPKLGDLILRLLEKKPANRFATALEVIEHLNGVFGLAIPLEVPETLQSYLEAGSPFGRESERVALHKVFVQALGVDPVTMAAAMAAPGQQSWPNYAAEIEASTVGFPAGRVVLLRGEKGVGKRRVVGELRKVGQSIGVRFLHVDGAANHETGAGGLESLVAELARFDWQGWDSGLPRSIQNALLAGGQPRDQEEPSGPDPTEAALEEVALGLLESSQDQPTVLCLQDAHLACRVVVDLVRILVSTLVGGKVEACRLLVIATAPDRSAPGYGPLQVLQDAPGFRDRVLEIRLPRLGEQTVLQFMESLFPGIVLPTELGLRVLEESDGNPEVVLGILGHLLRNGGISRRVNGWELTGDYRNQDFPGKSRGELKERISRLPADALRIAKAFACLGAGGPLDLAAELAAMPIRAAAAQAALLTRERILQPQEEGGGKAVYGFVHSSCRALVYEGMIAEERQGFHERAATLLEARSADPLALAQHFIAAKDAEKGPRYGLRAARALRDSASLADAAMLYMRVEALLPDRDGEIAREVRRELAEIRLEIGDYHGVVELASAGPRAPDSAAPDADLRLQAVTAMARLGQPDQARALLGEIGRSPAVAAEGPARAAAGLASAEVDLWEGRHVEVLRSCRTLLAQASDRTLLRKLHVLAAESCLALHHREEAATHCQMVLRLLDGNGEMDAMAAGFFWRGMYYLCGSHLEKAKKQFRLALILCNRSGARGMRAECLYQLGGVHHRQGAAQEALDSLEEAVRLFRQQGHRARTVWATVLLSDVQRTLGRGKACGALLRDAISAAAEPGDRLLEAESLVVLAALARDAGDLPKAKEYLSKAEASTAYGTEAARALLSGLLLRGEIATEMGDAGTALRLAAEGVQRAREIGELSMETRFRLLQASLLADVGRDADARKSLIAGLDMAGRFDLPALRARGLVVRARMCRRAGALPEATRLFGEVKQLLSRYATRRELMELQHEQALVCLVEGRHEEGYLNLEEGLHAATELGARYGIVLFHCAMGRLEAAIDPSQSSRALDRLLRAARLAAEGGYRDLLWRVQLQSWNALRRCGRDEEARAQLEAARGTLREVLESVPSELREGYLAVASSDESHALRDVLPPEAGTGPEGLRQPESGTVPERIARQEAGTGR